MVERIFFYDVNYEIIVSVDTFLWIAKIYSYEFLYKGKFLYLP